MYPFRHFNSWRSGRKGRTGKLVNVKWILSSSHGRSRHFHIREKWEIGVFNSKKKVQDC